MGPTFGSARSMASNTVRRNARGSLARWASAALTAGVSQRLFMRRLEFLTLCGGQRGEALAQLRRGPGRLAHRLRSRYCRDRAGTETDGVALTDGDGAWANSPAAGNTAPAPAKDNANRRKFFILFEDGVFSRETRWRVEGCAKTANSRVLPHARSSSPAPAPLLSRFRPRSLPWMNGSISPSITACTSPVSTPVRRSLTIW